ncbi:MAG TPA: APC family permease [Gaiellaceae bacterium]|nr:APC family permease [Gaiellaceae bacterium]
MPRLRRYLIGRPMPSGEIEDTLLPVGLALPIFSADAISSVAYATEAAMVVLVGVSLGALHWTLPISISVAVLMAIVVASYRQTVHAYEQSGGAYVVAKENLGKLPSLVAAAALLVDYILTVAVSVASGILAITSAVPSLGSYNVELSLAAIALIALVNLRGVREAGVLFALPTYGFVVALYAAIATGVAKCAVSVCPHAVTPHALPAGAGTVGVLIVLKAFASGASALTGVEAIANGVNAFKRPQSANAARTLLALGVIAISLFLGVSWLAVHMHARPSSTVSVLSQVARGAFPAGGQTSFLYWVVQIFTFAVLVLAANTSFQGFPRLSALLARDGFVPRQFTNLGDRLVFSNGVIVLTGAACGLIVAYHANVNSLIHLYVVGVFTAFTLSQAGMVRYWNRAREQGWHYRAVVNGIGALTTGVVAVIVVYSKFTEGAWLVIVTIPLLVLLFLGINRHYRRFARRLRAGVAAVRRSRSPTNAVLLWVEAIDVATEGALWYARRIANGSPVRALLAPGAHTDPGIRARWWSFAQEEPRLEVLEADEGRMHAMLEEVWQLPRGESDFVTVVVPEQFKRQSLLSAAGRTSFRLKLRLLGEPGLVVTDVPVVAREQRPQGRTPKRLLGRILLANVHAGSLRALAYAQSLGLDDLRVVSFAFDEVEARRFRDQWERAGIALPLDLHEAPYRDIGTPLLAYIRDLTADPETAVNVVMPEIVVRGWARLLHNQRALYIKRLLLFEPHVILSSVPYQLFR